MNDENASPDSSDGLNMAALFAAMSAAGGSPTEASADVRSGATQLFALATAYVEAGFTPEQSLYLLGQQLHGGMLGAQIAAAITGPDGGGAS